MICPICQQTFNLSNFLMTTQPLQSIPTLSRMTCFFCQQFLLPSSENAVVLHGQGYCNRHLHNITYSAEPEEGWESFAFYTRFRDCAYRVECYKLKEQCSWRLEAYTASEIGVWNWKLVVHLNYFPIHITPDNIDNKLPTLLVFS